MAMDANTREYFRSRPLLLQNLLWDLEVQGKRVTVSTRLIEYSPQTRAKRNPVYTFSRQARLRLLKFVASMDWPRIKEGLFVTLTYPEEVLPRDKLRRSIDLHLFHRYMENHLGREVPLLWRIEWVDRKTGKLRGHFCPHFHLIAPTVRWIHWSKIRGWWRNIVKTDGPLATDVKSLQNEKKHGLYVSKYLAKMPERSSLDNVSYLSTDGRHYGYLRKRKIPMAAKREILDLGPGAVSLIQSLASESLPWYDPRFDAGFTLLGDRCGNFLAELRRRALAEGFAIC